MSSDLSLLTHLFRDIGLGHNSQTLSISGTANQSTQSTQSAPSVSSTGGPSASQGFQVANSNVTQINLSVNLLGYSDLGTRAISNGDNGAYPNHPDSQSTNVQPSGPRANREDINAKLAAIKESTAELEKSTEELKAIIDKFPEKIAKLSEWVSEHVTAKDSLVELRMVIKLYQSNVEFSQSAVEFGKSSVECGESTVRDSDSIISMTAVGESISLFVFRALTLKLGEVAGKFKESSVRFKELGVKHMVLVKHMDSTSSMYTRLNQASTITGVNTFLEMLAEIQEPSAKAGMSINAVSELVAAFADSMVAYAESLAAPDHVIAPFAPFSSKMIDSLFE